MLSAICSFLAFIAGTKPLKKPTIIIDKKEIVTAFMSIIQLKDTDLLIFEIGRAHV